MPDGPTGKTGKCVTCYKPIYQFAYTFGGKTYSKWKHESDRGKKEVARHKAEKGNYSD